METIDSWVTKLNLQPHPEGGFFKETYRASEMASSLPKRFDGERNFSTAIYFLLRSEDISVFHRIKSDELWHFYQGSTLLIYVLDEKRLTVHRLGSNPDQSESFQVLIPANCWFGAHVEKSNSFALCGCTVAPGFDFQDFEMADRNELLKKYPGYEKEILRLTRDN